MAKEKSFEARVKCVRKNPGEQSLRQRKPFHTERPTTENARAWVMEVRAKGTKSNLCSDERSELRPLHGSRVGTARISEVGWSKTQDTPPDHGTNTEYGPLLEAQPVEYINLYNLLLSST